jgi:hypothetical protein
MFVVLLLKAATTLVLHLYMDHTACYYMTTSTPLDSVVMPL